MTSWLRGLALRAALLCVFLTSGLALAPTAAAAGGRLPCTLLETFDRALLLVYDAVDREIARIEAETMVAAAARLDADLILDVLGERLAVDCELAAATLDARLERLGAMMPADRRRVRRCIDEQLHAAILGLARARDADEQAEYRVTCVRLREVRRRV